MKKMSDRTIARRVEWLEPRHLLSATVFEHDGVAYFLNQSDPGFARYDISAEQWLAPIDFGRASGLPTVAHADEDGFYVAYGNSVYRYGPDGSGQTPVINAQNAVQRLHTDGNLLFINHSSGLYARLLSVNKTSNTVVDTADFYVPARFMVLRSIPGSNRIFGRSQGVSPSDISYVSYDDAGNILTQVESPYHGDYPGGSQTWVFDDGTKVVDNSGTIYTTALQYANSFGLQVTDIDFVGGQVPIVLSGSTLTAFSAGILPTGSATVAGSPSDLFVNDENAIVFRAVAGGWTETIVPLSTLSAPEPGEAIDPEGLPFTPDKIEIASNGTVLLFSKQHSSVFRFDPVTQTWGDTIPLIGSPLYMAYSAVNQKIYLAYDTGLIRQIDLASATLEDTPFATLPSRCSVWRLPASSYSAPMTRAHGKVTILSAPTAPDRAVDWNYGALRYTWSPANRKMYFLRDGTSPNDILWEAIGANGAIGTKQDSPLHDSAGFIYPIRVSPDGGVVILGSGLIHDARSLARLPQALGNSVTDVAWLGSNTHTIRTVAGVTQLQTWAGTNWGQSDVAQLPGTAVSLTTFGDNRMLAITRGSNGVPQMTIVDGAFNIVPRPIPVARAGADARVDLGFSTTLNGSESFDPDNSPGGLSYSWRLVDGPAEGQFGDADAATTSFSADVAGDYVVELTVSDGQYQSTDTVIVTYRLNLPPVVDTTGSATSGIAARAVVALTANKTTDPNGDSLTFQWELIAAPRGPTGRSALRLGRTLRYRRTRPALTKCA